MIGTHRAANKCGILQNTAAETLYSHTNLTRRIPLCLASHHQRRHKKFCEFNAPPLNLLALKCLTENDFSQFNGSFLHKPEMGKCIFWRLIWSSLILCVYRVFQWYEAKVPNVMSFLDISVLYPCFELKWSILKKEFCLSWPKYLPTAFKLL